MSEDVLVIENSLIQSHFPEKAAGLLRDTSEVIVRKIIENKVFMARSEAEYNYDHKQVIPYVAVRNGTDYLLLKRTKKQTEKRLHDKYSLGIGGHINPVAHDSEENIILQGLHRELNEEIHLHEPGELHFIGVIHDESNSVSRVHLGLLYVLDVLSPGFKVLEDDKMTAAWISSEKLSEFYPFFETWSQVVYDYYIMNNKILT
jgi:predicted NUDIX family phosphoesterase